MQPTAHSNGVRRLPRRTLAATIRHGLRRIKRQGQRLLARRVVAWETPRESRTDLAEGRLTIHAMTATQARSTADGLDPGRPISRFELTVDRWRPPQPGWSGRLGPVPGMVAHLVRLPARGTGPASVEVEVSTAVTTQILIDAALAVLDPARTLPSPVRAEWAADGPRPSWLRAATVASDEPERAPGQTWTPLSPVDVRLIQDGRAGVGAEPVGGVAWSPYGIRLPEGEERVVIDVTAANPIGRNSRGNDLPMGELRVATADDGHVSWQVYAGSALVAEGRAGDPLDGPHRTALGRLGTIIHRSGQAECAAQPHAWLIATLCATGVVIDAVDLPAQTRALLSADLVETITSPVDDQPADPVQWELRSIAQRRAAMRGHGVEDALLGVPGIHRHRVPTVSALLVTRRPSYLPRAMADLAAQTYPHVEVVLGLHGVELDAQTRMVIADLPFPVEVVPIPADLCFGEALAEATRAARGSLLTKVDDDDRYGPEHIWDLVLARQFSGATLVGKPAEFVHLATHDTTVRRRMASETFTHVVAGGTILIPRGELEAIGGWRPVARSVDRALVTRVRAAGGLVYRTHGFGFLYSRHDDGHTWDPGTAYFLNNPTRQWSGLPPYAEFAVAPGEVRA